MVKLLLGESEKVIKKIEIDISSEVKENYAGFTSQEINKINRKHKHFKQKLDKNLNKKWEKFKSREKNRSNQIIATGKTIRSFEPNCRKVDQILTKETHRRNEIERKSYAEILTIETRTIIRVDQFNTEEKNITVDMKNITEKKKKYEKKRKLWEAETGLFK